jgi:hypothetical protein
MDEARGEESYRAKPEEIESLLAQGLSTVIES